MRGADVSVVPGLAASGPGPRPRMLWRYGAPPVCTGRIQFGRGAVVADVLRRVGVEGVALKWPNDLLWGRRKLGW